MESKITKEIRKEWWEFLSDRFDYENGEWDIRIESKAQSDAGNGWHTEEEFYDMIKDALGWMDTAIQEAESASDMLNENDNFKWRLHERSMGYVLAIWTVSNGAITEEIFNPPLKAIDNYEGVEHPDTREFLTEVWDMSAQKWVTINKHIGKEEGFRWFMNDHQVYLHFPAEIYAQRSFRFRLRHEDKIYWILWTNIEDTEGYQPGSKHETFFGGLSATDDERGWRADLDPFTQDDLNKAIVGAIRASGNIAHWLKDEFSADGVDTTTGMTHVTPSKSVFPYIMTFDLNMKITVTRKIKQNG